MSKWENNNIQFARLLAEIQACCPLTVEQYQELQESMDLFEEEINELFDRADSEWERYKALTSTTANPSSENPASIEELTNDIDIFRGVEWTEANAIEAGEHGWRLVTGEDGIVFVDASDSGPLTKQQAQVRVRGLVEAYNSLGIKAALVIGKSRGAPAAGRIADCPPVVVGNHTPGPWLAREGDVFNPDRPWGVVTLLSRDECEGVDGDDSLYGQRTVVIAEVMDADRPEIAEADARLMAAAPALLHALREVAENTRIDEPVRWKILEEVERAGVSWLPRDASYRVIHRTSGTVEDWTEFQVLTEINRDHSSDFSPYLPGENWREGLREWTEWSAIDDPFQ